jgi:eukaryotic-like serine/threonine-protein kinase
VRVICPACQAENDPAVEACFTCGRALGVLTKGAVVDGRYEVVDTLGKGGMGMVYKAHDRTLDEIVALKVLRSEFVSTPDMAKRFKTEIKIARRISHKNVCRIHEYGEDGSLRFICMEFLEGTDLKQILRVKGALDPAEAFDVAIQVAEGLSAIHDLGIIHRDLKTPNIMRDARGIVKLMDFGIAKAEGDPGSGGLTNTGQVMGTPEYMSPEQCRGEVIDFRSDIYALGVVLYEIFTGQVPFRGDTPVATIFKHIQDPVPLSGPTASRLPPSAIPVIRRLLAKERNDRYTTAVEVAVALRQARESFDKAQPTSDASAMIPPPPPPFVERRRSGRLDIFVNLMIRRVGSLGTTLQEERTIAENIGRGGARVLTTMSSLGMGDVLQVEEVGGEFRTRAEVRNAYVGKDNIRRLNLRFMDRPAPDRLVRTDDAR